jgi:hypothetical protein
MTGAVSFAESFFRVRRYLFYDSSRSRNGIRVRVRVRVFAFIGFLP